MRPCPHCSKEIKDDVELCKWCLRPVRPASAGEPAPEADPVLQARAAHAAGARLFQIALPLSETTGVAAPLGTVAAIAQSREHGTVLDAIEAEGWHLNHVGYAFRALGSALAETSYFPAGSEKRFPAKSSVFTCSAENHQPGERCV
jgi:hypothetical protein